MPLIPHMTDQEIKEYLSEHDEEGFKDLPDWLRTELQARSLTIKDITKQCLLRRTRNDFQSQ